MPNFASGPYVWSYGPIGHAVGSHLLGIADDAPMFRFAREGDPISGDNLGAAIQGVVDRGGNMFVDMVANEVALPAVQRAFWTYDPEDYANPYANSADIQPLQLGRVGWYDNNTQVGYRSIGRLTPTQELRGLKVLNPGDIGNFDTHEYMTVLRFRYAQPAPGFNIAQQLGSRLRNVALSFLCLPYIVTDSGVDNTVYWDSLSV